MILAQCVESFSFFKTCVFYRLPTKQNKNDSGPRELICLVIHVSRLTSGLIDHYTHIAHFIKWTSGFIEGYIQLVAHDVM